MRYGIQFWNKGSKETEQRSLLTNGDLMYYCTGYITPFIYETQLQNAIQKFVILNGKTYQKLVFRPINVKKMFYWWRFSTLEVKTYKKSDFRHLRFCKHWLTIHSFHFWMLKRTKNWFLHSLVYYEKSLILKAKPYKKLDFR